MSTLHVEACEMNFKQFKYRCPYGCKQTFHLHGNCGDPDTNRVEHRICHCSKSDGPTMVAVHITANTKRKIKPLPNYKK